MRVSIIIFGLALMAIYIVHCDAYAIAKDHGNAVAGVFASVPPNTTTTGPDENGSEGGNGSEKKDEEKDEGKGDETDSKNNTAVHLESSLFKTIQFVVLPIVAAKIMM